MGDTRDDAVASAVAAGAPFVIAGTTSATDTTYLRAAGTRSPATADRGAAAPATADTVFALYSVTKLFTTTAALQCVEEGLIDLDAPARSYLPEIGDLEVLVDIVDDDSILTRPPLRDITPPGCCCCTRRASATRCSTRSSRASPGRGPPERR